MLRLVRKGGSVLLGRLCPEELCSYLFKLLNVHNDNSMIIYACVLYAFICAINTLNVVLAWTECICIICMS